MRGGKGGGGRKEVVLLGDSVLVWALCGAMFCLASLLRFNKAQMFGSL